MAEDTSHWAAVGARQMVADHLGVPAEDVSVRFEGGEWVAAVRIHPPLEYITITIEAPEHDPERKTS